MTVDFCIDCGATLAGVEGCAHCAETTMDQETRDLSGLIGRTLGPFRIEELLGKGGMGEVYRATDTRLQRPVAIKAVRPELSGNPDLISRLQREARVLATLNHPNIAALQTVEETGGLWLLVMEFVPGRPLAQLLKTGEPLPMEEMLRLTSQIAAGVEAAHEEGVVHRDLKPGNVMVTPEGKVKVLDFGLATSAPSGITDTQEVTATIEMATATGTILGTPPYMSPEQARGQSLDRRTDIWSFGCILYQCLTGKMAFTGSTPGDILAAIIHKDPDFESLPQNTPHRIRELLERCFVKDPAGRQRDIGNARLEIDAALGGREWVDQPGTSRERKLWPVAVTALVALGVGLLVGSGIPDDGSEQEPASQEQAVRVNVFLDDQQLPMDSGRPLLVSPDGDHLVFAADSQLFVRSLADDLPRNIPGSTDLGIPLCFSHDGRRILAAGPNGLARIPLAGGKSEPMQGAPATPGTACVWDQDDAVILGSADGGLFRIPARRGTPVALTEPEPGKGHTQPSLLPGGMVLLFSEVSDAGSRIAALELETGEQKILLEEGSNPHFLAGQLIFLRGEQLMAAPLDAETLELEGEPMPLAEEVATDPTGRSGYLDLSAAGTLAYIEAAVEDESPPSEIVLVANWHRNLLQQIDQ